MQRGVHNSLLGVFNMRNVVLALGLASALILAACGKKEEAAPAAEAPAAEAAAPAEAAPAAEAPAAEAPAAPACDPNDPNAKCEPAAAPAQ
jgi:hypothetical protein